MNLAANAVEALRVGFKLRGWGSGDLTITPEERCGYISLRLTIHRLGIRQSEAERLAKRLTGGSWHISVGYDPAALAPLRSRATQLLGQLSVGKGICVTSGELSAATPLSIVVVRAAEREYRIRIGADPITQVSLGPDAAAHRCALALATAGGTRF